MALYMTKTLVGRAQLDSFLNGTLAASGKPSTTGCTTESASATVTGPAGAFAEVQVGDRFYISGVDAEFTVEGKADNQTLTLDENVGADLAGNTGTWRAYRGAQVSPDDIVVMDANQDAGPTYHLVVRITSFG